ncbi:MurR/RpiR family transcriptional regulator [Segnochrobactrum spirostomi]|uniref:MurR/RpiR family transcriptional regulator n=1 Tax=Segnochrobactrum spirostomi TaxID=2608987 RepID=A0A6A7Y7H6_9HYPH|nr:MurR/RpiR family transcriptional regulator [Segnochrobactrum spirostomi]MQT14277.1 MurR/RpiR family transcriptional regulator [Segnochrobactrum spirostomi]
MSTRLSLRIQERFEDLSPSERKLAALLLEHHADILTYSATEMADLAGVSKATAARLFRSLGYADFNEVRQQAREERNRTAPFQALPSAEIVPLGARSIGAHIQAEIAALTRTFEDLRSDRLTAAAELVADAPKLWTLGLGAEEGLARLARTHFSRMRPNVHQLAADPGGWGEVLAMTGPRDTLLVFMADRRPKVLGAILDHARTTRIQVVAITDLAGALWVRRWAQVAIACHGTGGSAFTTMTSALKLLAMTAAARLGRPAQQRADLIAEIHEELDDLD